MVALTGKFYDNYIKLTQHQELNEALKNTLNHSLKLFETIPDEKWNYRYAPEKWSIKEVVQHIIDCERIFCYRALSIARGEKQNLLGFDENMYAQNSYADYKTQQQLIEEYKAVREGTLHLYSSFSSEMLQKIGTANNVQVTPNQIGYITAGHQLHHCNVILEKYL